MQNLVSCYQYKEIGQHEMKLTWHIAEILGKFLATEEDWEGVPAIIWLMHFTNFNRIIHQVIMDDLCISKIS